MCGIAGWYRRGAGPVDAQVVQAQCSRILHRGPDDHGLHIDADFGMGMRRLAVLDIEGGHQPMVSANGRYVIVFNGEIYNFAELREELAREGHHFRSRSDTEVILEAFGAWGAQCWPRLQGMFAVAIWDRLRRRLCLARDPLGIKPLYWTLQDGALAFASELKALAPVPGLAYEPSPQAIDQYLALGAVLAPQTIYQQIHKLPPGCTLELGPVGEPSLHKFWHLRIEARTGPDVGEWIEECRTQLLKTVQSHLVADVPLGAFLSGGVDSAAVVAAMTRAGGGPVRTFTIGFDEAPFDESAAAARVASHLGCIHTERRLAPGAAALMLDKLAPAFDEPFADDSVIPTWFVSQLAREQVTVALSGDGGDELFAGYRRHRTEAWRQHLMQWPGAAAALAAAQRLPQWPGSWARRRRAYIAKLAGATARADPAARFLVRQVKLDTARRHSLYDAAFAASLPADEPFARWAATLRDDHWPEHDFDAVLHADTTVWLPDDMLTKVDRMSMAHSLEVRVPLLAHGFVDWAAGVPRALKLRRGVGKWLLRQAVAPWLPPGTVQRPKQGFSVPLSAWMAGGFGDHVARVWREAEVDAARIFVPGRVDALIAEHRSGAADHGKALFTLLMFAYWWRERLQPLRHA